jgi:hypothetical protein
MKPVPIRLADAIHRIHLPVWRIYLFVVWVTGCIMQNPYVLASFTLLIAYWFAVKDCPINTLEYALRRTQDPTYESQGHGLIRRTFGDLGSERWLYALVAVGLSGYLILFGFS